MSITETTSKITPRSLMNKSKRELVSEIMRLLDVQDDLIDCLEGVYATLDADLEGIGTFLDEHRA